MQHCTQKRWLVTTLAAVSAFQHFSTGLGFRVIPALRQLRSTVRALTGFGFPSRLPAAPFENTTNNLAGSPPKKGLACLESGPFAPGRPDTKLLTFTRLSFSVGGSSETQSQMQC